VSPGKKFFDQIVMTRDDSFSASELRSRYQQGGSGKDSELSSSQLRARYDIKNNTFTERGNIFVVYAVIAAMIVAAYILKVWSGK
jgi:hypothetical protein